MSSECYGCGHHVVDCICDSAGLGEGDDRTSEVEPYLIGRVARMLIDRLHCCDAEALTIANRIAGGKGERCRHPDGVQVLEDAETLILAAALSLCSDA